jgi:hypothetical protein
VKILVPIVLSILGAIALSAVVFLLLRSDALPARVRTFDWRKAMETPPSEPTE